MQQIHLSSDNLFDNFDEICQIRFTQTADAEYCREPRIAQNLQGIFESVAHDESGIESHINPRENSYDPARGTQFKLEKLFEGCPERILSRSCDFFKLKKKKKNLTGFGSGEQFNPTALATGCLDQSRDDKFKISEPCLPCPKQKSSLHKKQTTLKKGLGGKLTDLLKQLGKQSNRNMQQKVFDSSYDLKQSLVHVPNRLKHISYRPISSSNLSTQNPKLRTLLERFQLPHSNPRTQTSNKREICQTLPNGSRQDIPKNKRRNCSKSTELKKSKWHIEDFLNLQKKSLEKLRKLNFADHTGQNYEQASQVKEREQKKSRRLSQFSKQGISVEEYRQFISSKFEGSKQNPPKSLRSSLERSAKEQNGLIRTKEKFKPFFLQNKPSYIDAESPNIDSVFGSI